MKRFIKWLNILFTFIEVLSALLVAVGILLKYDHLAGASEAIFIGLTFIGLIFFLRVLTPFYRRYWDLSPVMSEKFPLIVRRLLYFAMWIFTFGLVFEINGFNGTREMNFLSSWALGILFVIIFILIILRRQRFKVFLDALIRLVLLLAFYDAIKLFVLQ